MSKIAHETLFGCEFIYAAYNKAGADWSMGAHAHTFHELIVILRGGERVHLQGREIVAGAGDVLLYPMGVAHEEWAHGGEPLETIFLSFRWAPDWEGLPLHQTDIHGRIQELARWLYAEREAYFPGVEIFQHTMMRTLMAEYLRLSEHREHDLVDRIRAYVRARLDKELRLEELAARSGLSKYHFVRTYRALTGLSPMEDVRRIRLEAARHLLLTTKLPLKTVAPRTGFASEYHLSRLLRKELGVGARELRVANASRQTKG